MKPLPDQVSRHLGKAYYALVTPPTDYGYDLSFKHRMHIYNAFGRRNNRVANRARGWLGVLAAQKALPHYTMDYNLPNLFIQAATDVLWGLEDERYEVDYFGEKTIDELEYMGYHVSGNRWGYDNGDVDFNGYMAGNATICALREAQGYAPLKTFEQHVKVAEVRMEEKDGRRIVTDYQPVRPPEPKLKTYDTWEVGQSTATDAAACAALALSTHTEPATGKVRLRHTQLRQFWEWWIEKAVPAAWEAAQ